MPPDRFVWTARDVCDTQGPEALYRNYIEQRDLRELLRLAAAQTSLRRACDVGCGFGRLTGVLREVSERAVGVEREGGLLEFASRLVQEARFVRIASLTQLPLQSGAFDLALCFTVLQHLPDHAAEAAMHELKRIVRPGGWILLVEETDPNLEAGDPEHADLGYTRGRPVARYEDWAAPWRLVLSRPRRVEPTYPRPDVGTYMLFGS